MKRAVDDTSGGSGAPARSGGSIDTNQPEQAMQFNFNDQRQRNVFEESNNNFELIQKS